MDKGNVGEVEVIIKEGVQIALEKLEKYQALGYSFLSLDIYYLLKGVYKEMLRDNILDRRGNIIVLNSSQ